MMTRRNENLNTTAQGSRNAYSANRADREIRRCSGGNELIYKTHVTEREPSPVHSDDVWATRHYVDQHFEALADEAGTAVGRVERQLRDEVAKLRDEIRNSRTQMMLNNYEIARLRADVGRDHSAGGGEVVSLPKFLKRKDGKADAA